MTSLLHTVLMLLFVVLLWTSLATILTGFVWMAALLFTGFEDLDTPLRVSFAGALLYLASAIVMKVAEAFE